MTQGGWYFRKNKQIVNALISHRGLDGYYSLDPLSKRIQSLTAEKYFVDFSRIAIVYTEAMPEQQSEFLV